MDRQWNDKIFALSPGDFEQTALELFRFQYRENSLYQAYTNALGIDPASVDSVNGIPFLPIRFFKSHIVRTTVFEPELLFESSGTSSTINSRHYVRDAGIYRSSFLNGFEQRYGMVDQYAVLGLLPSYLERSGSSLVYMVHELVERSKHPDSGFYLDEFAVLAGKLRQLEARGQKTILIGVTFALLDFAESYPMPLHHTIIMETGGMKGRRRELLRAEVQDQLKKAFGLPQIHSEYGMTELLSQAYSTGEGLFQAPPWMRILVRDEEDPLEITGASRLSGQARAGALNIIDLANIYSCAFIATDDAVRLWPDGRFEILGRLDHSDLRGCSLLSL